MLLNIERTNAPSSATTPALHHENLTELANEYGSDKGSSTERTHRYTYLYDLLFFERRAEPLNVLELGLACGGPEVGHSADREAVSPSVQMWLNYFPNAHIFGFDISDFSHMRHPRFHFERGDSGSVDDLRRLTLAAPSFDIIIDDASHASYHQQLAFRELFPHVASGGLYIIEDLHWQPVAYEHKLPEVPRTAEFLDDFFEHGIYMPNPLLSLDFLEEVRREIFSYGSFPSFAHRGVDLLNVGSVRLQAVRKRHPTQLIIFRKQ